MNSRMIKRGFKRVGIYLAAVVVLLWTLLPILWMFISALHPPRICSPSMENGFLTI